jgi:hypothetical protein
MQVLLRLLSLPILSFTMMKTTLVLSLAYATGTLAFAFSSKSAGFLPSTHNHRKITHLLAAKKPSRNKDSSNNSSGRGFGGSSSRIVDKTYGANEMIADMIDSESAMREFFSANDEWSPLFRSMSVSSSAPAMSFLGGTHGEEIEFTETTKPWTRLQGIPTDDSDKNVLAGFLDSMQQALVAIPVDETTQEDDLDLHFIEEGRRMLVVSRFHVVKDNAGGSIENFDSLFSVCWSELAELSRRDERDTGSLILVPDYDLADLRRFTDMNLLRPLQWLGIDDVFEVASMQRGSPAIRLIHKLSDIPDPADLEDENDD